MHAPLAYAALTSLPYAMCALEAYAQLQCSCCSALHAGLPSTAPRAHPRVPEGGQTISTRRIAMGQYWTELIGLTMCRAAMHVLIGSPMLIDQHQLILIEIFRN